MANMIPISTVTVGSGGVTSIAFNNIPQIYTDLLIKTSVRVTSSGGYYMDIRFNGSTSGYSWRQIYGTGSSVGSNSGSGTSGAFVGDENDAGTTANTFDNREIYIPNYGSTNYKSISADNARENNATAATASLHAGLWSNTAPITSITLVDEAGATFAQYSTATLYGIRKY